MRPVFLAGSGTYLPGAPIPFDQAGSVLGELTQAPQRLRTWIESMQPVMKELLAIDWLHYAIDPITRQMSDDNVTMGTKAAQIALDMAGLQASDIDLICYGSAHQDQMPSASVRIQEALGIESCQEFSIHANCTSAYKALYLAHQLIKSGQNQRALVISSNIASSELRAEYFNQELLDKESLFLRWFLCDGAGAVVLSANPADSRGFEIEASYTESIGGKRPSLMYNNRPAYWMNPLDEYHQGAHHLRQQFRNSLSTALFQDADGSIFCNGLKRMLSKYPMSLDKVKFLQINFPARHIVDSVLDEVRAMGIPDSAFYTKLSSLGYSGPPMALICLDKIVREETFQLDDRILSFVTEVSKFMQAGYSIRYVGT